MKTKHTTWKNRIIAAILPTLHTVVEHLIDLHDEWEERLEAENKLTDEEVSTAMKSYGFTFVERIGEEAWVRTSNGLETSLNVTENGHLHAWVRPAPGSEASKVGKNAAFVCLDEALASSETLEKAMTNISTLEAQLGKLMGAGGDHHLPLALRMKPDLLKDLQSLFGGKTSRGKVN